MENQKQIAIGDLVSFTSWIGKQELTGKVISLFKGSDEKDYVKIIVENKIYCKLLKSIKYAS